MRPPGAILQGCRRPSLVALSGVVAGMIAARLLGLDQLLPGVGGFLLALLLYPLRRQWPHVAPIALLLAFGALGLVFQAPHEAARGESRETLRRIDGWPVGTRHVEGRIGGEIRRGRDGRAWFLLDPGALIRVAGEAEVLASPLLVAMEGNPLGASPAELAPGDSVRLLGRLEPVLWEHDSRSFDAWLDSQGAAAALRASTVERIGPERRSLAGRARHGMARVADRIEATLHAHLDPGSAGVASAMLLGRTANLRPDQREAFARAGLAHLFAVSGLHAGLAGLFCAGIATLLGFGARGRLAFLLAGLVLFCLLTGLRTSALRASLMLAVVFAQPLLRRPGDPLASLATVGLLLLLLRPRALWQVDFQLSFLCIGALIVCAPGALRIEETLGPRLGHGFLSGLAVRMAQVVFLSLAIQLATAPFLAMRIGTISLVSPLANMVVLPGIAVVAGLLAVALLATAFFGGLGALLFVPGGLLLSAFEAVARALASVPHAAIEDAAPWPLWLVAGWYAVLLAPCWLRHRPRFGGFDGLPSAGASLLGAGLLVAVWVALPPPRPMLTVTFLDVGQGDAILVESRSGHTMLVDTGPPPGLGLARELALRGVTRIDTLVLTHADADHIGGAGAVLGAFDVGRVVVGGSEAGTQTWESLVADVATHAVPVVSVVRGSGWTLGHGVDVAVLHPTPAFTAEGADRNDASIVLRLTAGGVRFLLTGDAEAGAEGEMFRALGEEALRADVLQAGHHGAAGSTGPVLLAAVRPRWVVASCGRDNRYGHPRPEVIERVRQAGATLLRTDHHGAVRFQTDGVRMTVAPARGGLPPGVGVSP